MKQRGSESESHFENEDSSLCVNLEDEFTTPVKDEGISLTQVPPESSPDINAREFVPPHSSVVFPMSQPILPSKFSTLPTNQRRPSDQKQSNARKVSSMFKRKSADLSTLSQSSLFSSPLFSKK